MGCGGVGNNVPWHLRIDVMLCQGWGGLGWVTSKTLFATLYRFSHVTSKTLLMLRCNIFLKTLLMLRCFFAKASEAVRVKHQV